MKRYIENPRKPVILGARRRSDDRPCGAAPAFGEIERASVLPFLRAPAPESRTRTKDMA